MRIAMFSLLPVLALFATTARADNWPHWRGPNGNGVAPQANPPTEWSASKNIKWKARLTSHENGSPIVWEDQVFLVGTQEVEPAEKDALPKFAFNVISLDRETGALRWKQTATVTRPHQRVHNTTGYASNSPCTDGERLYAHFGSRGLYCYTLDGALVWKRDDLGKMETLNNFGEGSSPTLSGDVIVVPWDHQGPSALWVLNKHTGDTIWKVDREEPTGWATPVVVEHAGRKQIVMNGQHSARGYDLETGEELWHCDGQTVRPICTPAVGDGVVYVCSGFQGDYMGAFRLDGKGDIKGTDSVVWEFTPERGMCDMSSPLLVNGRLYFHSRKESPLSCIDAETARPHYVKQPLEGLRAKVYASPIAAGGYVFLTGVDGTTVVIREGDSLDVVATNSLGEFVGGTPAAAADELYIRGEKHLFCIEASNPVAAGGAQ